MGLIKSINAPEVSPFSMRDIEAQARQLLMVARRAAEKLLSEAQMEGEKLKTAARDAGLAEGRRDGQSQGLATGHSSGHAAALAEKKGELSAVWSALSSAVTQLEAARIELEANALTEVVDLAAKIARRVTKRQAMLDPAVLRENLADAMKLAVHAADVRIVIHPSQRETLETELPKLQLLWPHLKHIELCDDAAVEAGGCRILTRHGEVNARIDEQLDRIISQLMPNQS